MEVPDSLSDESHGNSPKPGGDRELKSLRQNPRSGQRARGHPENQASRTVEPEAGRDSLPCRTGLIGQASVTQEWVSWP